MLSYPIHTHLPVFILQYMYIHSTDSAKNQVTNHFLTGPSHYAHRAIHWLLKLTPHPSTPNFLPAMYLTLTPTPITLTAPHTHLALNGPFVGWLGLTNDVNVIQVLLPNLDDHILDICAINAWLTCAGGCATSMEGKMKSN